MKNDNINLSLFVDIVIGFYIMLTSTVTQIQPTKIMYKIIGVAEENLGRHQASVEKDTSHTMRLVKKFQKQDCLPLYFVNLISGDKQRTKEITGQENFV